MPWKIGAISILTTAPLAWERKPSTIVSLIVLEWRQFGRIFCLLCLHSLVPLFCLTVLLFSFFNGLVSTPQMLVSLGFSLSQLFMEFGSSEKKSTYHNGKDDSWAIIRYILTDIRHRIAVDFFRFLYANFVSAWESPMCSVSHSSFHIFFNVFSPFCVSLQPMRGLPLSWSVHRLLCWVSGWFPWGIVVVMLTQHKR